MLICYVAATAVPTPYPAVVSDGATNPHCWLQLRNIPSPVLWLVPPVQQKTHLFPHPLWLLIIWQPGWCCPDSPAQGLLHPPGRRFSSLLTIPSCGEFAATELHNRSDLLICPLGRDLLTASISSFCSYLLQHPLVSPVTQGMRHQAADCLRSCLAFLATTLMLLFNPLEHLQICS